MQIILLERVNKLGSLGEVVKVKDGYARNYLIPMAKALRATKENIDLFAARRAEIEQKSQEKRQACEIVRDKVAGVMVSVIRQAAEDGRLFGSVTSRDIADALYAKGHKDVDRLAVFLATPIKAIGIYNVDLNLYPEVSTTIQVNVARSAEEAAVALEKYKNNKKKELAAVAS
jgi:large subunit ribosomal protein L9